jgi:hypothetical protein
MIETSKQIHDRLLCSDCEQILNSRGENWVLQRLAVGYASPLYYALQGLTPVYPESSLEVYPAIENPEFDADKIVHFALGVFFKAAAHNWLVGKRRVKLDFGPYLEPIRRYLLGEASFPTSCTLTFCLLPPTSSPKRIYNPYQWTVGECKTYSFGVIGLEFWMSVGERIPQEYRELCFATGPNRPVVVSGHTDSFIDEKARDVIRSGGARGKLAKRA